MKRPKKIDYWYDLPDRDTVPDGYDRRSVPSLSRDNLEYLFEKHNELVDVVTSLIDRLVPQGEVEP